MRAAHVVYMFRRSHSRARSRTRGRRLRVQRARGNYRGLMTGLVIHKLLGVFTVKINIGHRRDIMRTRCKGYPLCEGMTHLHGSLSGELNNCLFVLSAAVIYGQNVNNAGRKFKIFK